VVREEIAESRTETAKEFGLVRKEIAESKTETAKEFGLLRASIERMKLWGVVAIFGAALATSAAVTSSKDIDLVIALSYAHSQPRDSPAILRFLPGSPCGKKWAARTAPAAQV